MGQRKLLLINKFYHDVGPAGGVGRYLVQEEQDLAAAGWEVVPFAMADADARPSPWSRPLRAGPRLLAAPAWAAAALGDALSLIWNREAARSLERLIVATRPDVAHLHNIYHHLSPSILPVLRRHRIPVVMTLHDLRLLCPAIHMLRDGQVCERCRGGHFHQAVLGRCVKDSRAASLLAAVETAHQRGRRLYEDGVRRLPVPQPLLPGKVRASGVSPGKNCGTCPISSIWTHGTRTACRPPARATLTSTSDASRARRACASRSRRSNSGNAASPTGPSTSRRWNS